MFEVANFWLTQLELKLVSYISSVCLLVLTLGILASKSLKMTLRGFHFANGIFLIFFLISDCRSAKVKIYKPSTCDKLHTWFSHGQTYTYSFTAFSNSGFVGASESKAGFKYTCLLSVNVPRKCEGLLKIDHCELYDRQPGPEPVYNKSENSEAFSKEMSQHTLYFQYDLGEVNRAGIVTSVLEKSALLNIKRAILSSFQLKVMPTDRYDKEPHQQTDIFGECLVAYRISDTDPDLFYTERNLRLCEMPQIYQKPRNIFSMVQRAYGGYKVGKVLESIYPFSSTVKCEHQVNRKHQLIKVDCLQQQIFEPTAYNGSIYASYMTNISQSLELTKVVELERRSVNRRIKGKKYVDILFEFEDEHPPDVTKDTIDSMLHQMVDKVRSDKMEEVPGLYHQLVLTMKSSETKTLMDTMRDIWSCHGNNTVNCDSVHQHAEKDYFLDGLLSCGSHGCLKIFSHCLKNGHVTDPFTSFLFTYDLATNHDASPELLTIIFDLCKGRNHMEYCLPLGIMVQKFLKETDPIDFPQDHIITQIVSHLAHEVGYSCYSDIWQLLDGKEKKNKQDHLILIFKVLGNIGSVIQKFPSLDKEVYILIKSTLLCMENSETTYHLSKSALQAIGTLNITTDIRSSLLAILNDTQRKASIRTQAFMSLADTSDEILLTTLLDILHTDVMDNIRLYMTSFIEAVLESDQPDRKEYQELWRKVIKKDGRKLPHHSSFLVGKTHFIDLSRFFKPPLSTFFYGLQLEINVVYDPVNPSYQSVVIRLNYFHGQKFNLLEVGSDLHGLHQLYESLLSGGYPGLSSLVSLFMRFNEEMEKSTTVNAAEMFGNFFPELVQELRSLFQHVNNHSNSEEFGGLLHLKMFGHEVAYADAHVLLEMLHIRNFTTKVNEILEAFLYHFNKGYHRIKTRSSQIMDLTKVLPTVSGASLNMTVLALHTSATEVKAKFSLKQFLLGIGPVNALASILHQGAFEFLGQMTVTLPSLVKKEARMVTSGVLNGNLDIDAKLTAQKPSKDILEHFVLLLFSRNDGTEKEFAVVKNRMILIHGDGTLTEEVPFIPNYHGNFERCYAWSFLTEQQVCVSVEYPNVTSSSSHAYFPLSGPFTATVIRKNSTFKDMKVVAEYKKKEKTKSIEIIIDTTGVTDSQRLNLSMDDISLFPFAFSAHLKSKNLKVDFINDDESSYVGDNRTREKKWGISVESQGQKSYGIMWKAVDQYINRAQTRNKSLELIAPELRLELIFNVAGNIIHGYKNVKIQRKLYCTKAWPMLYPLHLNTKVASENGDMSDVFLEWGYNTVQERCLSMNICRENFVHFGYPGQDVMVAYDLRRGKLQHGVVMDIAYLSENQNRENVSVSLEIDQLDKSLGGGYRCVGLLEHKKRYQVNVTVFIKDFSQEIGADFDLSYKLLKPQNKSKEDTLMNISKCRLVKLLGAQNWKMKADLSTVALPVQTQSGPAANIDYRLTIVYPSCDNYVYLIVEGAYGRLVKQTYSNHWSWFNSSLYYGSHKEENSSKENINTSVKAGFDFALKRIKNKEYLGRFSFLLLNTVQPVWYFNTSCMVQYLRNNTDFTFQLMSHNDIPWQFWNYNLDYMLIGTHERRQSPSRYENLLDFSNSYLSLKDNTTLVYTNWTNLFLHIDRNLLSKISFIPLNLTLSFAAKCHSKTLPDLKFTFFMRNKTYFLNLNFITPMHMNVTLTSKAESTVNHLLTLESKVTGSSQLTNTVVWPTSNTSLPLKLKTLGGFKDLIGQTLIQVSNIMMDNLRKTFPEKEIPLFNMTVQDFFQKHLKQFMTTLPFTSTFKDNLQEKLVLSNETGSAFIWHLDVYIAKLLKMIGNSLLNPPATLLWSTNDLQKNLAKVLKEDKIVWVVPFPVKIINFLSWDLDIGQKYLKHLASLWKRRKLPNSGNQIAFVRDFRSITTFDKNSYEIPVDRVECKHLLAADFQFGRFALVLSRNEVTLFTVEKTVTVDNQGRIFLGDCNTPTKTLPSDQKGMKIFREYNTTLNIETPYGINLKFYPNSNHFRVTLTSQFKNQTLGLLGNPDSEQGTDWRNPDGEILPKLGQFLPAYALGHPMYCHEERESGDNSHLYKESTIADQKSTPVDIVLVAMESIVGKENLSSVFLDVIQSLKKSYSDINVGVLITGSKNTKKPAQYFMGATQINATTLNEVWRTEKETDMFLALKMAASYPHRTLSHKLILLLSPDYDILDTSSLENLKTLFELRKLTLYMASNYQKLRKNVVGISWDSRAIMHQSDRFKMMTFPEGESMELLEETSGALLDIEPILGRDLSKIETLVNYIHEETTRNGQCQQSNTNFWSPLLGK